MSKDFVVFACIGLGILNFLGAFISKSETGKEHSFTRTAIWCAAAIIINQLSP